MNDNDQVMEALYNSWCIAAFKADCLYDELDEDFTHPLFLAAEQKARIALFLFLSHRTASPQYILLKLQVACDAEDYLTDALDPACTYVAPRAVVGAMHDLEKIVVHTQ